MSSAFLHQPNPLACIPARTLAGLQIATLSIRLILYTLFQDHNHHNHNKKDFRLEICAF